MGVHTSLEYEDSHFSHQHGYCGVKNRFYGRQPELDYSSLYRQLHQDTQLSTYHSSWHDADLRYSLRRELEPIILGLGLGLHNFLEINEFWLRGALGYSIHYLVSLPKCVMIAWVGMESSVYPATA